MPPERRLIYALINKSPRSIFHDYPTDRPSPGPRQGARISTTGSSQISALRLQSAALSPQGGNKFSLLQKIDKHAFLLPLSRNMFRSSRCIAPYSSIFQTARKAVAFHVMLLQRFLYDCCPRLI